MWFIGKHWRFLKQFSRYQKVRTLTEESCIYRSHHYYTKQKSETSWNKKSWCGNLSFWKSRIFSEYSVSSTRDVVRFGLWLAPKLPFHYRPADQTRVIRWLSETLLESLRLDQVELRPLSFSLALRCNDQLRTVTPHFNSPSCLPLVIALQGLVLDWK